MHTVLQVSYQTCQWDGTEAITNKHSPLLQATNSWVGSWGTTMIWGNILATLGFYTSNCFLYLLQYQHTVKYIRNYADSYTCVAWMEPIKYVLLKKFRYHHQCTSGVIKFWGTPGPNLSGLPPWTWGPLSATALRSVTRQCQCKRCRSINASWKGLRRTSDLHIGGILLVACLL